MKIFTYRDNSLPLDRFIAEAPILIEVEAGSILEADKIFETHQGTHPSKLPSVGVSLHEDFTFQPLDFPEVLNYFGEWVWNHTFREHFFVTA